MLRIRHGKTAAPSTDGLNDQQAFGTLENLWGEPRTIASSGQGPDRLSDTLEQQGIRQGLGSPVSDDSNVHGGGLCCPREQGEG